ncbi:hypothetical protein DO97_15275 [Neosynechococcus sphagnicola sy1]|uniref:Uncharacterized protein n=1 Tax=Neosynechococcus sphagnicola sy1 TaxID=1497020 RepID=A0A098TSC4_9CYAN|nr:hypothetical protein DO97_15275 [Neosynechococcus sphagnicola sy1]
MLSATFNRNVLSLNITAGHAPRIQRQNLVIKAIQASLPFGDQLWLKRILPVTRYPHLRFAELPFIDAMQLKQIHQLLR